MSLIGRIVLSLPPSPGNARNSEGAYHLLNNGDILFVYSKFIGDDGNDDGYSTIAGRVSKDNGETWSNDTIMFRTEDHNAKNIMSVSFLKMQNGDIGLFYIIRMGWHDTRIHLRRSSDGGKTWGEAKPCIPAPGYFVTNNDRIIRIKSGRIIIPANQHRMKDFDTKAWTSWDSRGIPVFYYSDDDGATWNESGTFSIPFLPHSKTYMHETGVIEKLNGSLYAWMRTDLGCQYESYSMDEGITWTMPAPSMFTSPPSPLCMKRMPLSGKLLAVWNPIWNYYKDGKLYYHKRTPLVLATSADDGVSWSDIKTVENDPDHGYCYTAIHFTNDLHVLLAYCAGGREDGGQLNKLVMRKIKIDELP